MDDDISAAGDLESVGDDVSHADSASFAVVRQEIKMMNIVRTFVFALMITFATIGAEVMFVAVRMRQEAAFRNDFTAISNKMLEGFFASLQTHYSVAGSLANTMTFTALDIQTQWPFTSFPDFDQRVASTRQIAMAAAVTFAPVVPSQQRTDWESYATYVNSQGILVSNTNFTDSYEPYGVETENTVFYNDPNRNISQGIYRMVKGKAIDMEQRDDKNNYIPLWQLDHGPQQEQADVRMFDQLSTSVRYQALTSLLKYQTVGVLSDFLMHDTNQTDYAYYTTPRAALYYPIVATVDASTQQEQQQTGVVVGVMNMEYEWQVFLQDILDGDEVQEGIVVVVESSTAGRQFTFQVNGPNVTFLGPGDQSTDPTTFSAPPPVNSTYSEYVQAVYGQLPNNATLIAAMTTNELSSENVCQFRIQIYATEELRDSYLTNAPDIARAIVLAVLISFVGVFICYDCVVEERSNRVVENAKRTDALVSTLFPSSVKQRLLENAAKKREADAAAAKNRRKGWQFDLDKEQTAGLNSQELGNESDDEMRSPMIHTPKRRLKSFLHPGDGIDGLMDVNDSEPIADLFPNASIVFADIAGFTAWSSERDPSQVFRLLETLYRSMDKAARRFKVFKVETIGDCYVAATGLPDHRDDHVEAIVRFARTSLLKTNEMTKALEATLGPGTSELAFRFGIHSGPVTAGVLRGEKARFQLFGDTMNFAARMESTGLKNRIQLSEATANILKKRGKGNWVAPREETVFAKGKGEVRTYWLLTGSSSNSICSGMSGSSGASATSDISDDDRCPLLLDHQGTSMKHLGQADAVGPQQVLLGVIGKTKLNRAIDRLVDWNTGALTNLLKKVMVFRNSGLTTDELPALPENREGSRSFISEVEMVIPFPSYNAEAVARMHEQDILVPQIVTSELRLYVAAIASGYRRNEFHNFEHASHVCLSATKLLKRISYADGHHNEDGVNTLDLHQFTYGISTDPLTQFAVVFAALIHDVGHEGVPNGQLSKELPNLAQLYANQSIAEQRSVDVALELLKLPKYKHLRQCICATEAEQKQFHQLLIHCVLATDIFEPELKKRRNERWDQAFHKHNTDIAAPAGPPEQILKEDMNRKATIVLEHIIQASDVSHTMQHWHVYIKWNERLFNEMYGAYKAGRAEKDPSEGWYKGELWFYDNYVIPLAKKLKECGVFGVSSDEYLDYAVQNRTEWEQRGEEICKAMKEKLEKAATKKPKIAVVPEADETLYPEDLVAPPSKSNREDEEFDGHASAHSYTDH